MFNKRTHRVVFAVGVLLVLSLAAFGSMIAVAWMSMNNTMVMTSDAYSIENSAVETSAALAWRIDPNTVRILDYRVDPNTVKILDFRVDPNTVRILDYRVDPNTVRILDFKDTARVADFKLDPSDERTIDFKETSAGVHFRIDPNTVRILDHKEEFRALCPGGAHYAFDYVLY
ncbi:MAG: hypothetical protein AM325_004025 [Candidatus Thorarchaeota archaeon SMTZ1-45]|nr:MAG: hypothetical protein AM325_05785 [Candidatus Thorarchaeota archaeon SMTZ1-45]